jgi:hypothetical protein
MARDVFDGHTQRRMARSNGTSRHVVKASLVRLYQKLGVEGSVQLVLCLTEGHLALGRPVAWRRVQPAPLGAWDDPQRQSFAAHPENFAAGRGWQNETTRTSWRRPVACRRKGDLHAEPAHH